MTPLSPPAAPSAPHACGHARCRQSHAHTMSLKTVHIDVLSCRARHVLPAITGIHVHYQAALCLHGARATKASSVTAGGFAARVTTEHLIFRLARDQIMILSAGSAAAVFRYAYSSVKMATGQRVRTTMMEMVMNRSGRTQLPRITKMKLPIALCRASLRVICNMPYVIFAPC